MPSHELHWWQRGCPPRAPPGEPSTLAELTSLVDCSCLPVGGKDKSLRVRTVCTAESIQGSLRQPTAAAYFPRVRTFGPRPRAITVVSQPQAAQSASLQLRGLRWNPGPP